VNTDTGLRNILVDVLALSIASTAPHRANLTHEECRRMADTALHAFEVTFANAWKAHHPTGADHYFR
jgi:hypothetical protein